MDALLSKLAPCSPMVSPFSIVLGESFPLLGKFAPRKKGSMRHHDSGRRSPSTDHGRSTRTFPMITGVRRAPAACVEDPRVAVRLIDGSGRGLCAARTSGRWQADPGRNRG